MVQVSGKYMIVRYLDPYRFRVRVTLLIGIGLWVAFWGYKRLRDFNANLTSALAPHELQTKILKGGYRGGYTSGVI